MAFALRHYFLFVAILFLLYLPSSAELNQRAICSSAKRCLTIDLPGCSEKDKKPLESLEYGPEVCGPFLELASRGVNPKSSIALQMFSSLGDEYRVVYEVTGKLPVNAEMMKYLFDHMPFTSRLINAYQGTNYTLAFSNGNKWNFHGDNGSNLKGRFHWVREDSMGLKVGRRNTFWGAGSAKVLMWQLHGVALVFLDYDPIDHNQVRYRLRSIVFPANAFLNSVMQMDMFRNIVMEKMEQIVGHVEASARVFAKGDRKPIAKMEDFKKYPWLKSQLLEFEEVVKISGYGQKVWPIPRSLARMQSSASTLWNPVDASSSSVSTPIIPMLGWSTPEPPMILNPISSSPSSSSTSP